MWDSFYVVWNDDNGDELFQLDELAEFSGVTSFFPIVGYFEQITAVPESQYTGGSGTDWQFTGSMGLSDPADRTNWDYTRSATPIPASVLLLGSGLLGLGFLGWRKRR